jgi:hypothetical protein
MKPKSEFVASELLPVLEVVFSDKWKDELRGRWTGGLEAPRR